MAVTARRAATAATSRSRRLSATLAGAALAVVVLAGCGEGGVTLPTALPTALPSGFPTALPTRPPEAPEASQPAVDPTLAPPETTEPPAPIETTAPPAEAETQDPQPEATQAPVETSAPSETTEPPAATETTAPPAAAEEDTAVEDDGQPGWLWWVLGLLVAAAVAGGVVLGRRRKAQAEWAERLAEALREATWLGHELVPNLHAQGPAGRAGIWAIGRPRVLTLEQTLGILGAEAADPTTARQVAALSSAVQALQAVLDQASMLADFGGESTTMALRQAQRELDDAVGALQPPPPPAPEG